MKKNYIVMLIIFLKFISPVIGIENSSIDGQNIENLSKNYTTLVDNIHGFYRVYESNKVVYESNKVVDILVENYANRTLNINIGDTVFWSNDAVPDTQLTILSKQNLWTNISCGQNLCADLRWNYKKFGYKFNKSGIYKVYIKQFPIFNQTIIVGSLELISKNSNSISNKTKNNDTTKSISSISSTPNKIAKQNSTLNMTNSVSNVKSFSIGSDTIILTIVLLSMIILSGKIKDE